MAERPSYTDRYRGLPTEVRLQIWAHAIPREASVVSIVEVEKNEVAKEDDQFQPNAKATDVENKVDFAEPSNYVTQRLDAESFQADLNTPPVKPTVTARGSKHIRLHYPFPVPKYKAVMDPTLGSCLTLLQVSKETHAEVMPLLKKCTVFNIVKLSKEDAKLFWRGLAPLARQMCTNLKAASRGPDNDTWLYYMLKFSPVPRLIVTISGGVWRDGYEVDVASASAYSQAYRGADLGSAFDRYCWNTDDLLDDLLYRSSIERTFELLIEGADENQCEYLESKEYLKRRERSSGYKVDAFVKIEATEDGLFDVSVVATKAEVTEGDWSDDEEDITKPFQIKPKKTGCRFCWGEHEVKDVEDDTIEEPETGEVS